MSRSKTQTKQNRVDDLWTKIESESIDIDSDAQETTVLFVGDPGSGKTTLINSFLKAGSSKQPKPTFALDYSFARKKNATSSNNSKSVAHIWELGGDIQEPGLLDIPISVRSIKNLSVVICCDLSKPHNILQSMRQWIKLTREVISRKISEYNSAYPDAPLEMDEARLAQFAGHSDERIVSLSKVPFFVVANKYDIFKDVGSVERRVATQVLRFVCHYYGATLLTTSAMDPSLRDNFKAVINAVCFRSSLRQVSETNHEKPVHVTPGRDSFDRILLGSRASDGGPESLSHPSKGPSGATKSRLANSEADLANFLTQSGLTRECWGRLARHLQTTFESPPDDELRIKKGGAGGEETAGEESEHPEPEIDEMRSQRDAILKRYVQELERREAMQARMAAQNSGSATISGDNGGPVDPDDGVDDQSESKSNGREKSSSRRSKK